MQYRYIVVEVRDGGSWHLYGDPDRSKQSGYRTEDLTVLPDLLADGWVPVRETPIGTTNGGLFGNGSQALCLVLLSREF